MQETDLSYEGLLKIINKPTYQYVNKEDILVIARHFARLDRMTQMRIISEIPHLLSGIQAIITDLRAQTETEIKAHLKIQAEATKGLNKTLDVCDSMVKRDDLTEEQISRVLDQVDYISRTIERIQAETSEKVEQSSNRFWRGLVAFVKIALPFAAGIGISQYVSAKDLSTENDNSQKLIEKKLSKRKNSSD